MQILVDSIVRWDKSWFSFIFGLRQRGLLSRVMLWMSHSGNGYYYPLIPVILALVDQKAAWLFVRCALLAFAVELPLYKVVKSRIRRFRPFEAMAHVSQVVIPSDQFSFPSGHTAAAFIIASLMGTFFPIMALPAFAWAALVGFSRIYLGVHYPTDVLAGMGIGTACALLGLSLA